MEFERELARLKNGLVKLDCAATPQTIHVDVTVVGEEVEAIVIKLMLDYDRHRCSFQSCDDAVAAIFFDSGFDTSQFYFDGTDIDASPNEQGLRERGLHFYRSGDDGARLAEQILLEEKQALTLRTVIRPRATNPNTTQARAWRISQRLDVILRARAARLSRGDCR